MLNNVCVENWNDLIFDKQPILQAITVAFIDSLQLPRSETQLSLPGSKNVEDRPRLPIKIVRLETKTALSIDGNGPIPETRQDPLWLHLGDRSKEGACPGNEFRVRTLIGSISHQFNNLLMGIWGNTTLIRFKFSATDPLCPNVLKMENLIESGSFLIHMVFGYLGERRVAARRIRLEQIIQEIQKKEFPGSPCSDTNELKQRLQWATTVQQPKMIAGSTAKVLNILLQGLNAHHQELSVLLPSRTDIHRYMDRIDVLIQRGQHLVQELLTYAGEIKPTIVRVSKL